MFQCFRVPSHILAWTDTQGEVHGVVPQPSVRRGGAQPLLPLIHRYIDAALLAESRRPARQPLAGDRGKYSSADPLARNTYFERGASLMLSPTTDSQASKLHI